MIETSNDHAILYCRNVMLDKTALSFHVENRYQNIEFFLKEEVKRQAFVLENTADVLDEQCVKIGMDIVGGG